MAFSARALVHFLRPSCVLPLLLALAVLHAGAEQAKLKAPAAGKESRPTVTLRGMLGGSSQEFHSYVESLLGVGAIRSAAESALLFLESLLGQENVRSVAMFLGTVIRFLAEGAASGLNVIAVYVTEILRVTGFDAALTLPRFTPEGVTTVAQWGVVAVIGYWVLTILLRLVIDTLRHVFWLVKMAAVLWLFAMIVSDGSASADTTAVRLGGLVLGYILLTLLTTGSNKNGALEHRLKSLEGRVKAVEKRKGN
ncbi:voltage-gated monoatomic cation channel TMEM109-like isoform X2 [Phycodurus eques]|uniref:voltage-gated monoatomic cation channel TMEM109-like isoform X2 n=1 Tax=Phycodurus eques TaxID=693459 RepID=UPI002ACE0025|nr:voltage-gated monoatomic cation channel TMEM109-like isoform X2 [Phycodurus eques]